MKEIYDFLLSMGKTHYANTLLFLEKEYNTSLSKEDTSKKHMEAIAIILKKRFPDSQKIQEIYSEVATWRNTCL